MGAGATSGASPSADVMFDVRAEIDKKVKEAGVEEVVSTDFSFSDESFAVCVSVRQKMNPFWPFNKTRVPHATGFKHVFRERPVDKCARR